MGNYEKEDKTIFDFWREVKITDKTTGEMASGEGTSMKAAERNAFEALKSGSNNWNGQYLGSGVSDKNAGRSNETGVREPGNSSYSPSPYYGPDSSDSESSGRGYNERAEGSTSLPWQGVAAAIFGFFGLKALSRFFYSAASDVYILNRHQPLFSARMLEKSGEIDTALNYLVMYDKIFEAERIARKNGLERKLLDKLEKYPKREDAAELARELKMYSEAMKNYEILGNTTLELFESMRYFEEAGEMAECAEDIENAIRLYKRGWETANPKNLALGVFIIEPDRIYAEGLLKRAERLEESQKNDSNNPKVKNLLKKTSELRKSLNNI